MKKSILVVLFLLLSLAFWQCSRDTSPVRPGNSRPLTPLEKKLVQSSNTFGWNLFKEAVVENPDQNIFISPLSVSVALGMTVNGAAGETENAMKSTLGFGDMSQTEMDQSYKSLIELLRQLDPNVIFQLANSIWCKQGYSFEQDFLNKTRTYFQAEVKSLNFSDPKTVDIINQWAKDHTNGKITRILDNIPSDMIMYLINAIYFKGTWTYRFNKDYTKSDLFYLSDGTQDSCKLMNQKGDFEYFSTGRFEAIDLPYGDGAYSMTVFLPREGVDIDSLIAQLTPVAWRQWMAKFSKQSGTILLPKFKIHYDILLNNVLQKLGMEIAFNPQRADFTRMLKIQQQGNVYIGMVKHNTFVRVDEEGTEAAAVTTVGIGVTSVGPRGFLMVVNRPFLFVIREHASNTILFAGKIVRPQWEN
ncbi:serpin [bacterium BMS3Abin05]|nr:serpin [bacterium BMS3Abin05]GBE26974.1 serpin [bacterium BMS3Bbin03]